MLADHLTPVEINRYIQQIKLSNVGIEGQLKLKKAKVLCIGAGGLGTPLLLYLANTGIGTLGIIDDDFVETSNLPRQIIYQERHTGTQKVLVAEQRLLQANPYIHINSHPKKLTGLNAAALINEYDIIADCSDNFNTRYLINEYCFKLGKPYVTASVLQHSGQCTTFLGTEGPCLRCLFPSAPLEDCKNCNEEGVLGVLPGLLGIMQATEIIKLILQTGELLLGRVLVVDIMKMQFREFHLPPNPHCSICACHPQRSFPNTTQKDKLEMNNYLISTQELKKLLQNKEDLQLVDVRTPEKHQLFNIGGKLLPFEELPHRLNELDPTKPIVTYCTSGGKSMRALQFLLTSGFKLVKSLDGGITAWQNEPPLPG